MCLISFAAPTPTPAWPLWGNPWAIYIAYGKIELVSRCASLQFLLGLVLKLKFCLCQRPHTFSHMECLCHRPCAWQCLFCCCFCCCHTSVKPGSAAGDFGCRVPGMCLGKYYGSRGMPCCLHEWRSQKERRSLTHSSVIEIDFCHSKLRR